eukprot:gene12313-5987_t
MSYFPIQSMIMIVGNNYGKFYFYIMWFSCSVDIQKFKPESMISNFVAEPSGNSEMDLGFGIWDLELDLGFGFWIFGFW